MKESVKLIRVFLASPGDLREERIAARDAADEINRLIARPAGYQIELLGWEETISGIGRPQALINQELESCELFIGAMWKRWGTPPSKDGSFTSGFEEEYQLSMKRFSETGRPQMGMFFKNVDPELLADPGEDLKKVVKFQKVLIDEKAHLFETFDTKEEFAQRVRQFLANHVHARALRDGSEHAMQENAPKEPRGGSIDARTTVPAVSSETTAEPTQDSVFLQDIAPKLHQQEAVSDVDIARLRLISVSVKGAGNTDAELGVHDANLIYRDRASLELSKTEITALARTGLANVSSENVPFWTWYVVRVSESRHFLLLSSYAGTEDEKVGALEVMRAIRLSLPEDGDLVPFARSRWFDPDTGKRVKTAALRYLRHNGSLLDIDTIKGEIDRSSSDTLKPAVEALAAIYLRNDPAMAARSVLESALETIDSSLLDELLPPMDELSNEELQGGLGHRNPRIRSQVLQILSQRGILGEASLRRATQDSNSTVRRLAVELLDRTLGPIEFKEAAKLLRPPASGGNLGFINPLRQFDHTGLEEFKRRRFMQCDTKTLEETAASETSDKHLAMFCLSQRQFTASKDILRSLVDDKFTSYISEHWPEGVPGGIRNALAGVERPPEEEKRRELMRAALDVLESKGDASELGRVRQAIDDDSVSVTESDLEFIAKYGNSDDVPRIVEAVERSRSEGLYVGPGPNLFSPAARSLLKIVSNPKKLLETTLPPGILKNILILYPTPLFAKLSDKALSELFMHENESVRKAAALKCLLTLSKGRITTLLRDYLKRGRQFYNVIHWLDLGIAESRAVARTVAANATAELA